MDLSSLSNATTQVGQLSNLILVTPQVQQGYQPQNTKVQNENNVPKKKALLFHYEGENSVSLESDITDHVTEDNSSINDQIAIRPEVITVHGYIGELNDIPPNQALSILKTAADRLTNISGYMPGLSASALNAYNQALQLYQAGVNLINTASTSISTISDENLVNEIGATGLISKDGNSPYKNQNKQQTAFQEFYQYWRNRTLFTVQTPWAIFQNMAIKNLRVIQNEETSVVSDFEITFKMIRYAKTLTLAEKEGRANNQASAKVILGEFPPASATISATSFYLGT